jgi:hypothetical protein
MTTLKKIIGFVLLLTIIILTFIYLSPQTFNNNVSNNSQSTSSTNNITKLAAIPAVKDNKTIEIEPKVTGFGMTENLFEPSQVTDKEFAGIKGAKVFSFPETSETKTVSIYTVNSTFAMSDASKTSFNQFKSVLDSSNTLGQTDYFRLLSIFRNIDEVGGYQKELLSEITTDKPKEVNQLRTFLTQDGIQFPSAPTITIIGKDGNDYFLIENRLKDIDHIKIFDDANTACEVNNKTVNDCVKTKYSKALSDITTANYLTQKAKETLDLVKF